MARSTQYRRQDHSKRWQSSKSLESLGATAVAMAPQLDKSGSSGGKLGDIFNRRPMALARSAVRSVWSKPVLINAAAAFSVQSAIELGKSFLRTADAVTNLNSQLKLATGSASSGWTPTRVCFGSRSVRASGLSNSGTPTHRSHGRRTVWSQRIELAAHRRDARQGDHDLWCVEMGRPARR